MAFSIASGIPSPVVSRWFAYASCMSFVCLPPENGNATELMVTFRHRVFLFSLLDALHSSGNVLAEGWQLVLSNVLQYVPMYVLSSLSPRFILNIWELYARDVEGRRGEGIDTGFGLSLSGHDAAAW